MDNNNYTPAYNDYIKAFKEAQLAFNKKPCTKTATILSNLRETKWLEKDMYTPSHLKVRKAERIESDMAFIRDMQYHLRTIEIEELPIPESQKAEMHKLNIQ